MQLRRTALDGPVLRVVVRSRAVAPVEGVAVELGRAGAQVLQRYAPPLGARFVCG